MGDPVALALKFGFLAVLYLFLLWVARSSLRDLRRTASADPVDVAQGGGSEARRGSSGPDLRAGVQPRFSVVAALGLEPGTVFDLSEGATVGRAESSDIRIDDPFASSAHASVFSRGQFMHIEDMGSTNGTYLNGRALRGAERLKPGDRIRIGDTEYAYEE